MTASLRAVRQHFRGAAFAPLVAALLALGLAGCSADAPAPGNETTPAGAATDEAAGAAAAPPPSVPIGTLEAVALELGTSLDADGRVSVSTERVRAGDTVHVSLVTVGEAEAAMLAVRWRDAAGTLIAEDERAITASGPAVHTFSRKPEAPWPPGAYEVEVLMGGESAGVRAFEVR